MTWKNAAVRGGLVLKRMGLAVALGIVLCGGAAASSCGVGTGVVDPGRRRLSGQRDDPEAGGFFRAPRGQSVIRIAGITADMVDASVQASLSGAAGVKIADVKVEVVDLSVQDVSGKSGESEAAARGHRSEKIKGATNRRRRPEQRHRSPEDRALPAEPESHAGRSRCPREVRRQVPDGKLR